MEDCLWRRILGKCPIRGERASQQRTLEQARESGARLAIAAYLFSIKIAEWPGETALCGTLMQYECQSRRVVPGILMLQKRWTLQAGSRYLNLREQTCASMEIGRTGVPYSRIGWDLGFGNRGEAADCMGQMG